jgi:hypothetical protein
MESAYNSKTGESLFLVDDEWVAPESTATNPKTGERAFLVNNEWQIKPALPTFVSAEEEAAASKPSFVNPIIAKEAENIRRIQQQRVPPKPVATPIAAVEQPPYKSRQEALDDAVNLLEENQNPERIKSSFEQMGIPWTEIISHGKARNSKAFAPQEIQPIQYPEQNLPEGSVSELPEITAPESIVNMFKRGNASFKDMSTSLLLSAGAIGADDAAMALRESARKNRAAAPSVDIQEGMSKIGNAKTFGDAVEEMYNHPVATFTMLADSAYTSIPAIAPALALGRFVGPKARGVTAAIGSGISEYSSVLVDVLQSKGIDLLDAERVGRALQDPKILAEIKENGAKRGLIVGTFDGLTMGIAGMFMRPAMKLIAAGKLANQAAKRATVAAWGKELAVQMVGGGGGEFAAQKATGENKPAAVLLEALAEIPLTPLEVRSSLGEARQLEREAGNYDAKRIMEEKGFFPPKTKQPESTLQTPTPPTTPAPPIVKEATPEGTQPPEVSAPGLLKEEDLPLETGTEEVAKQVEVPASGIVPVSQADEATPIVVYHDPIQNMEARVVQMSDGRFSVTMKDLDSGQFLPMAKIFDNLDGANKYAVDIAGPDAVNATINKVIVEPPAAPPVVPAPPPTPPQASVEAEPPAPVTPVVPAVSKPPEATPAAKEPTVTEILNHPIQPKIVGRAMDMSRDQLQKVADAKDVFGIPTSDALLAKEELDLRNKAAEPKVQVGSLVTLQKNGLNGPINIAGTVSRIMPNGELEIRTQNGDIVIRPASEVSVARDPVATPKADIGEPAPKPIKEPVVKILGKNVRSTKMTLKELNRYANGKNADGTPSEASFIAQTELDRRADIKAAKPISPRELARRERLRQQARERLKIKDKDSLIDAIVKLGGISMKERQDIIGDTKGNYKIDMVGYLFARNGTGLDDLATQLHDLGYLSLEEYEDLGGVRSLTEKIQDDWNKERSQHKHFSFGSEEQRFKQEQQERDEIEQELIKAQEQEGETSNKKDQQLALSLSDALALMTPEEIDELDVLSQTLTDAAWEAEVIKRAQEKIRANQQQNEAGVPAGEEAPQEPRAEGLELQAPTEEELRAEQEARDASEAAAKKKADDEEAKRKEAGDREEINRRSVAAADDFNLTPTDEVTKEKQAEIDKKKAEEQLAGQRSIDDKPDDLSPAFSALTTLTNLFSPKNPATSTPAVGGSTETMAMPGVNASRIGSMFGAKLYGKPDNIAAVSIKELLQNSFDAIKEALEKKQITQGSIQIRIDDKNRTITVTDNGPGMPGSVMGKEFLELAGTVKGTSRPSGGLGVAKMLFVYENEQLEVVSLRDGVVSRLETTGAELKAALAANPVSLLEQLKPFLSPEQIELMIPMIQESARRLEASGVAIPKITVYRNTDKFTVDAYANLFPSGSGTSVKVTVPKSYIDQSDGQTIEIPFDRWSLKSLVVLNKSPLFDNIEVSVTDSIGTNIFPIGKNFPIDKYTTFANVKFNWGVARIYVTKDKTPTAWSNTHILSNGLWQFDQDITINPSGGGENIKREFYIDVVPNSNVKPEDPGYPFELNRQNFAPAIKPDFSAIFKYISTIYKQIDFKGEVKSFGTVQYINDDGTLTAPKELKPTAPPKDNALTLISPGDTVEVRDGAIFINNRQVPELTQEQIKSANIDYAQLTIPQNEIDPNKVMVHDNTTTKERGFLGQDTQKKSLSVLNELVKKYPDLYSITPLTNNLNPAAGEYAVTTKLFVGQIASDVIDGLPSAILKALQSEKRFESVNKNLDEFLPPSRSLSDAARAKFGVRYDKYLSTIGKVFYNLRRGLVDIDPTKYAGLDKEAIGVSIDKGYYGVSIKIPFSGMFINPSTTELHDTPEQIATSLLTVMIHELAHFKVRSHRSEDGGAGFASEMQRILILLRTDKQGGGFLKVEEDLTNFINANLDIFNYLNKEFRGESYIPSGDVFKDASANKTTDEGRAVPSKGVGDAGGGRGIRESSGERANPAGQEPQRAAIDTKTSGAELEKQSGLDFNEEEKRTEAAVKADPVAAKALHEADAITGANKKLPPGRSPELAAAAEMVKSGVMPAAKFDKLVNRFQPITIYTEPPLPASNEQMFDALDASKREKINPSITTGTLVGLRLDIPAWNRKKVSVISIHTKGTKSGAGYSIGYTNAAKISSATFGLGNQTKALTIAAGVGKDVFQTIEGSWTPTSPDQVYTQAKSALSDPAWTQIGIDPTRHSYAYDRRTTMPVVSAEEILMVGKMVLGKNVTYGKKEDFLFNISSIPPVTAEELESNREEDRKETISRYAGMRRRMQSALVRVGAGEVDLSLQQEVARLIGASRNLKFFIDTSKPTIVSPEKFLAKALTEFDNGNISAEVLAVIQAIYEKQPELLQGLQLSVKQQDKGGTAGQFFPLNRIVRLFKSTEGTQDPKTIRHEITHSLEQMMGPAQQMAVYDAWLKDLQKAINKNTDEIHKKYFAAVLEFIKNPNRATLEKAKESMPGYDMYQYINPSEYWAVNAERLLGSQLGSAWQRFKMFVRRLFEGLKSVFGFDNKYAIHKTFNQIMSGNKERISKVMLVDLVTGSKGNYVTLNNRQDDIDLKLQYSRSDTPMIDQNPIRNGLVKGVKIAKEVFVESAKNPIRATAALGNAANRASIYLRNKNVFFGTGLNIAEQSMYKGALRDSNNMAIASVALDNALRGGIISSEVIMRGGIQWNPNSLNFVAVNKPLGMAGVYKAEGAIKKRAGNQLGTDIVQGYLEAKRSLSINNEFEKRTQDLEDLKNMLINLRGQQSPNPQTIAALKDMINEAKKDLTAITLVKSKVMMGDQQIQDYIAREAVYPELRDIMDNWNAVNQNMLKFWKDVGMISKGRYDVLSKIEDYVPWNRIMDDSEDINSPLQSTTRSMTNIGREKLFKKGVPTVVTKFVAQNGQRNFNIQPASMVNVSVNGNDIPSSGFDVSPDGEVKFANPLSGGDRVVFTTNREIENMIDNMTRNVMRMTMNGLRQYAAVRIVSEFATRDANNRIEVFPKADRDKGRFDFIANGKRIVVEIEDPLIAEAIFGMESLDLKMYKYLLGAANLTRRLITLSGAFQIQMVFQDAPTAALVSGVKNPAALFGGVFKGFLTALTGTEPVVDILKRAGIGGFHSPSRTPEAAVKQRLGIMNRDAYQMTMGLLDHLGDSSDMAQRVATYKRVLKETGDEAQALYQAANVINFLHHGSSAQAQFMAKTVPFLGAYANSIDVLAQAAAGGGLKGRDRASAAKRFWLTGAALSAITLLYCMMVGDDEEYMKLDDPSKLRSYMVPGTKFVLPMHSSAAFFFKAMPEMLYNKIINEGTNNEVDARRLRRALAEAARDALLGPTLVPSGAKPFVEILLNHDFFTGKAVVPAGLAKVDSADQYVANTSELAKLLGNKVINPIEMDHIIRGMFGSAGAMAQWFSNVTFYGSENRPATTLKETPILGRFVRPEVPRGREDLFYDLRDQVDSKYQTFTTKLGRLQGEEASKYLNENIDLIKYHKYVSKMGDKLNEVNNAIKLYGTGKLPGITPQERRERIEQFQEIKNIALQNIYTMRKGAGM